MTTYSQSRRFGMTMHGDLRNHLAAAVTRGGALQCLCSYLYLGSQRRPDSCRVNKGNPLFEIGGLIFTEEQAFIHWFPCSSWPHPVDIEHFALKAGHCLEQAQNYSLWELDARLAKTEGTRRAYPIHDRSVPFLIVLRHPEYRSFSSAKSERKCLLVKTPISCEHSYISILVWSR